MKIFCGIILLIYNIILKYLLYMILFWPNIIWYNNIIGLIMLFMK